MVFTSSIDNTDSSVFAFADRLTSCKGDRISNLMHTISEAAFDLRGQLARLSTGAKGLGSRIYTFADNLIPEKADRLLVLTQSMSDAIRGIGQHFTGLTTVQLNTDKMLRALRFSNLFGLVRYPIKIVQTVKMTYTGIKIGSISETVIRATQFGLSVLGALNAALFVPFAAIPIVELFASGGKALEQLSKVVGLSAVIFGIALSVLSIIPDSWKVCKGLYLAGELLRAKGSEEKLEVFLSYLDIDLESIIEKSKSAKSVKDFEDKYVTGVEKDIIRRKLSTDLGSKYSSDAYLKAVDAVSKAHQKRRFELRVSLGHTGCNLIEDLKSGKRSMSVEKAVEKLTYLLQRRLLRRSIQLLVSVLGLASTILLLITAAPIPTLIATAIWLFSTGIGLYFASSSWLKSERKEGDGAGLGTMIFATAVFLATISAALVLSTTPAGYIGVALLCLLWLGIMSYTIYSIKTKVKKPDALGRIT